ncbi:hypothetical protein [Cryptosporangium arvum]|uniref:hypothetical protein n=1 Tax=Cryptosporangium arvum TaxID=80871 RepID=UPI0004B2BED1|nr:hypothetical protein [Cryptosporangium arvum]
MSSELADLPLHGRGRWRPGSMEALGALLVVLLLARGPLTEVFDTPAMRTWATVFVAIAVQALPFLALGMLIGAAMAVFVPRGSTPARCPGRPRWPCRWRAWPGWRCGPSDPDLDQLLRRRRAGLAHPAGRIGAGRPDPGHLGHGDRPLRRQAGHRPGQRRN